MSMSLSSFAAFRGASVPGNFSSGAGCESCALQTCCGGGSKASVVSGCVGVAPQALSNTVVVSALRSEEHTSELQSLMRISYAVFCLNKKKNTSLNIQTHR